MGTLRVIKKVKDKQGRVIGCIAIDTKGREYKIPKKEFHKYKFSNVIITKDLKIKVKDAEGDYITLYHGSHNGLVGDIQADKSRQDCDFGKGFYTGDNPEQAKTLIIGDADGLLYTLGVHLGRLKVYYFKNEIEWALYVGVKRGYIDTVQYKKLAELVNFIDSFDVIVGLIADDRMAVVYPEFVLGNITDTVLIATLSYVKYGKQYVFKNNAACKQIEIMSSRKLTAEEKKQLKHIKNVTIGNMIAIVDSLKKQYRREGSYIDEILEQWR